MADLLVTPLVAIPGGWELVLIVLVIVLLFGAKKLPELARNTGRSLRIFKAETKGLMDDDDEDDDAPKAQAPRELDAPGAPAAPHGDPLREGLTGDVRRGERRDGTAG